MSATLENVEWSWKLRRTEVKRSDNNLNNVIGSVSWTLEGEFFGEGKEQYQASISKSIDLPSPSQEEFISIDNLDKKTLLEWTKSTLGNKKIIEYKQSIVNKINDKCKDTYIKTF